MTTQRASRDDWLHAYEAVYFALPEDVHRPCPNCGHDALQVVFIGGDRVTFATGERIAYAFFWCGHCHFGLHLSQVVVPDGVEVLPRGITPEELAGKVPEIHFIS